VRSHSSSSDILPASDDRNDAGFLVSAPAGSCQHTSDTARQLPRAFEDSLVSYSMIILDNSIIYTGLPKIQQTMGLNSAVIGTSQKPVADPER
jgi:hypothetical protein